MDAVSAILDIGRLAIRKIWPDPVKQAEEERKLLALAQEGDLARLDAEVKLMLAQIEVNKQEAQSKSVFVAGWRPAIGWVGAASFAYAAIIEPILRLVLTYKGLDPDVVLPQVDTAITIQVLLGMLGLGIMRSYDKKNKTQTDSISNRKEKK